VVDVPEHTWRFYYEPILALFEEFTPTHDDMGEGLVTVRDERLDVTVSVDAIVLRLLQAEQWAEARAAASAVKAKHDDPAVRSDGLRAVAGQSWLKPFDDEGADRR
jgi:hypothetical protein